MPLNEHALIISLLSGLMLFAAGNVAAETLEDAWNIAIDNNHQIKSAKADTSASEQTGVFGTRAAASRAECKYRLYPVE